MLKQLYIRNFTLIDELKIPFHAGFSVITGETGAGKSIILGAISLLLGQRADMKSIKKGCDRCVIEAHFDLSNYEMQPFFEDNDIDYDAADCILRRELTAAGKSRAFINDTPVALTLMRQLGQQLVDIHSQHQNLLLQETDFQMNVVDIIAKNSTVRERYSKAFLEHKRVKNTLEKKRATIAKVKDEHDYLAFIYKELNDAKLRKGMQVELEQESERLNHIEEIKETLYNAQKLLDGEGILSQLKEVTKNIHSLERHCPDLAETANRLDCCYIELKDIALDINAKAEQTENNPQRLDEVNAKLDNLYGLLQKHHLQTEEDLIALKERTQEALSEIENADTDLELLEQKEQKCYEYCKEIGKELSLTRKKAAQAIETEMVSRLITLGMPHVRFKIQCTDKPLSYSGADGICFLFSANTSTPPQPLAEIASGGEIARVMLSIKALISGTVMLPTIIFDEIDTGVSGKIAEKMGNIMQEMSAQHRQIISITHLPQIASKGNIHYKVFKEETSNGTKSHMRLLNNDERVQEIAQMLSGCDISNAAIQNAKELLQFDKTIAD